MLVQKTAFVFENN